MRWPIAAFLQVLPLCEVTIALRSGSIAMFWKVIGLGRAA